MAQEGEQSGLGIHQSRFPGCSAQGLRSSEKASSTPSAGLRCGHRMGDIFHGFRELQTFKSQCTHLSMCLEWDGGNRIAPPKSNLMFS